MFKTCRIQQKSQLDSSDRAYNKKAKLLPIDLVIC